MTTANITITDAANTVSVDESASVASVEASTSNITVDDATGVVTVTNSSATIVEIPSASIVVAESDSPSVVTMGVMGPQGPSSEDLAMYAERIDSVSGGTIYYKGWAVPNSAEAAAVWRIQKIVFTGDDVAKTWADGSDAFNQVWDDRLTLDYS